MFTALEIIPITDGKHLFASMFGNGSIAMMSAIAGIAVIAVVVIHIRKKKKDKGEEEDE